MYPAAEAHRLHVAVIPSFNDYRKLKTEGGVRDID
jgi:hypothetical protein